MKLWKREDKMKNLWCCLFIYIVTSIASMGAQNLDWQFAVQAGGVGAECTCTSLCTDADGNIYVAGGFSVAIAFGDSTLTSSGGLDIFVAKLDPWGNWL
ncbi:MAG: hypothetical protein PHT47_02390, partial [Candidatus Cloacimonetes bacterium]|nr:hypothetical protein [Candidatus Cloacimonadota bacterium]